MFKFGKSTIENKLCTIDEKLGREIDWNLKIPKEVEVPITLKNTSKFYHYLFVIYFHVLSPTLHPNPNKKPLFDHEDCMVQKI